MNRLIVLALICAIPFISVAQEGDYFVSHFTPTLNQEEQTYFDLLFTSTDEMVAANRSGIVRFDGNEWQLIRTPSAPLSIALDSAGNMFVGCADDFGRIEIVDGDQRFVSLADDSNRGLTLKTLVYDNNAYFLQGYALQEYDPVTQSVSTYQPDSSDTEFVNMLIFDGVLWAETSEHSYFLADTSLDVGNRLLPDESLVLNTSVNPQNDQLVISGSRGEVYLYTDHFTHLEALSGMEINDLSWVSEDIFAISTLSDGLYFYDIGQKEIVGTLNSDNGLLDNEVFAIASDGANGVWIAHTFGFTRVAPLLPIRSFNHYPGLDGNLTTAAYINDTWNIATSSGIYYFDQIDKYKNIVYYVPKRTSATTSKSTATTPKISAKKTEESSTLRSKVGGLLARRKNDHPTLSAKKTTKNNKPAIAQLKTNITNVFQKKESNENGFLSRIKLPLGNITHKIQYERRVRKKLISTQYLYRQVPDITDKVKQLIPFDDNMLAVTPSGIVEITANSAVEIFDEPVKYVFHPEDTRTLWVSSSSGVVTRVDEIGDVWVDFQTLVTPGDIILNIYQDSQEILWMAGANQLFKVVQTDSIATVEDSYPLENQFFDKIRFTEINDLLYLVNNQGIFTLDTAQNMLVKNDTLMQKTGQVQRHLIQTDHRVWIYNGDNWVRLESDGTISHFTYLKLFPEMTFIEQVGEELWLINDHHSLFKFAPNANDSIPASQMYYREISDRAGLLSLKEGEAVITYDQNSVRIEMARPDYLNLVNVEYQYHMVGLSDDWSDWSASGRFDFNYLPAGRYTLEVRSRDAFGRMQQSEPITFRIKPPYWQTTWFSALQVLFFTGLVIIASRLNRQESVSKKQLILSNLLTIVTIVMVIELLQNIAESFFGDLGSPVLAFGLDVFVALLIFPIEILLRKIVTGKGEVKLQAD